jgi:hypothetical protein
MLLLLMVELVLLLLRLSISQCLVLFSFFVTHIILMRRNDSAPGRARTFDSYAQASSFRMSSRLDIRTVYSIA